MTGPSERDLIAFVDWANSLAPAGHVQARVGLWLLAELERQKTMTVSVGERVLLCSEILSNRAERKPDPVLARPYAYSPLDWSLWTDPELFYGED